MAKTLTQLAQESKQAYINACNAVIGRGGSVPSGMPFSDLANAITNIPHDQTLAYQKVASSKNRVIVPQNAEQSAMINKIGGMTYKSADGEYEGFRHTKTTSVVSEGVNRFDFKAEHNESYAKITIIDDDTFSVTNKRNATASEFFNITFNNIPLYGSRLYFKCNVKVIGSVTNSRMIYRIYDKDGNKVKDGGFRESGDGEKSLTTTIPTDLQNGGGTLSITLYSSSGEATNEGDGVEYSNVILSYDVDLPYTRYKGDAITIPEAIQNLEGFGLGIDETYHNYIDLDRGKYIQNVYEFELKEDMELITSFLSWQTTYRYYVRSKNHATLNDRIVGNNIPSLCDRLNPTTYNKDEVGYYLDTSSICIYFKSPYPTVEETVEWLKGTKFILPLAEPIETDISEYLGSGLIKVEGGGTTELVNEHNNDLPSETTYIIQTVGG